MTDTEPALPNCCPRCEESYYDRMPPSRIGRMVLHGDHVVCHHDGFLYLHREHPRLEWDQHLPDPARI